MHDTRILNATLVTESGPVHADIGIDGGVIVEIAAQGSVGPAQTEFVAEGLYAMPGAVDIHFHCRAPSHPERGDFASETAAAAAGGVTTVFEMPISEPACSTPEVLQARRSLVDAQAHVNVALYSGAAIGPDRAVEMAELGAIGFKLFTIAPTAGRESEFEGLWATGDAGVYDALAAVARTGLPCVVHAESDSFLSALVPDANGILPRPPAAEAVAIASAAALAKEAGARIHIAHVSSESAVATVRGAIAMGADITAETCPQYLLLDESAVARFGGLAKIAPPLRTPEDAVALWAALVDGTIGVVASDHSPFLAHEKADVEFARAPQGLPTVELLVPSVLDAAARGVIPLELAVGLVTSAPARLFGLGGRKGTLSIGADADITLFSLGEPEPLQAERFHSRAKGVAVVFEPLELRARIERTLVRGRVVFADGRVQGEPVGAFLPGPLGTTSEPQAA